MVSVYVSKVLGLCEGIIMRLATTTRLPPHLLVPQIRGQLPKIRLFQFTYLPQLGHLFQQLRQEPLLPGRALVRFFLHYFASC